MSHERLSGAWNFRDVAETTGVLPGRLFRSSELSNLDDAGRLILTEVGVTDVADLRSPAELQRRGPGAVPEGVAVHNLPFPEVSHTHDGESPHESSWNKMLTEPSDEDPAEAALRWMTGEYERFPTLAGARRAVHRVVTLLGQDRPVLVHCFAGKDRTGFAVAVACEAAGVDRDAILADYLRSNDAVARLRARILETMRSREGMTDEVVSFAASRLTDEVLGVREEYLVAARRVLDETYGGLAGYLTAAGVTDDDVALLRARLLG
ncbi:MAG: tyrosine-protein phosphatase [Mycobacterium sp.]